MLLLWSRGPLDRTGQWYCGGLLGGRSARSFIENEGQFQRLKRGYNLWLTLHIYGCRASHPHMATNPGRNGRNLGTSHACKTCHLEWYWVTVRLVCEDSEHTNGTASSQTKSSSERNSASIQSWLLRSGEVPNQGAIPSSEKKRKEPVREGHLPFCKIIKDRTRSESMH